MKEQDLIKVGNCVKIRQEPKFARVNGFTLNSLHPIQEPPKNGLNTPMAVYLKTKTGKLVYLQFPYWCVTNVKDENIARTHQQKQYSEIKRKRKFK